MNDDNDKNVRLQQDLWHVSDETRIVHWKNITVDFWNIFAEQVLSRRSSLRREASRRTRWGAPRRHLTRQYTSCAWRNANLAPFAADTVFTFARQGQTRSAAAPNLAAQTQNSSLALTPWYLRFTNNNLTAMLTTMYSFNYNASSPHTTDVSEAYLHFNPNRSLL